MLTDASALLALFHSDDNDHDKAIKAPAQSPDEPLVTTLPCFTEATRLVSGRNVKFPDLAIYQYLDSGYIQIHLPTQAEIQRTAALVLKYKTTPMSLADASLIAAAETLRQRRIFTYDSDFYIYQINDREPVQVIQ